MSLEQVGEYNCTATNELGDGASRNITLNFFSTAAVSLSEPVERSSR